MKSLLIVITPLAALLLLASPAAATPGSTTGVISGCYQKSDGRLRVIDTESGAQCHGGEIALQWGLIGPQGAPGPAGPQGSTGETGATGDQGPVGPSNAYTNYGEPQTIGHDLTQTVASVTLPAGRFTLSGTVEIRSVPGATAYMTCSFVSLDIVNQPAPTTVVDGVIVTTPVIGDVTITQDSTSVFLRCGSLGASTVVKGAMIATKVGTITPSE